jgi:phosphoglycolate phosphatase
MSSVLAGSQRFGSMVFDFDYTLADSSAGVIECVNYALERMGLNASDPDAIRATIGVSLADTYRRLTDDSDAARSAEFERIFAERGDQVMLQGIRLFDTVRPTVEALCAAGLSLGIVSTKYRRRIEAVLERDGLERAFAVVIGGDDVQAHKPDPAGLEVALAALQRAPSEALYVGDSTVDAETARRASVPFVAVLSGVTPREAFSSYEPEAFLDELSLLPGLLL